MGWHGRQVRSGPACLPECYTRKDKNTVCVAYASLRATDFNPSKAKAFKAVSTVATRARQEDSLARFLGSRPARCQRGQSKRSAKHLD